MSLAGKYMAPEHEVAFKEAAKRYKVWILLRAANADSRRYIGLKGYVPKRLDCKAKTAKKDLGKYKLAGLVVDPTIHPGAFGGRDVIKYWNDFLPRLWKPAPGERRMYLPPGKLYTVQMDPEHEHYGCVAFTGFGLATKLQYIYGDYDLYGIVSERDPSSHVFVAETRLGVPHTRTPELFDVQHYLNRAMGIPMVLHGAQESYSPHTDEDILIFWPDGVKVEERCGKAQIEEFYSTQLARRAVPGDGRSAQPHAGLWKRF